MTMEQRPADDLIADYVRSGWTIADAQDARPDLDFRPDYLLKKGNEFLVVEVMRPGRDSDRSVAETRRLVEQRPNWHFAVKLQPPRAPMTNGEIADADIGSRLGLAENLLRDGYEREAVLLAWVAIETSLRRLVPQPFAAATDSALPGLIRAAYEAAAISDPELRAIDRARELRNRIAHGFKAELSSNDTRGIIALARALFERAAFSPAREDA